MQVRVGVTLSDGPMQLQAAGGTTGCDGAGGGAVVPGGSSGVGGGGGGDAAFKRLQTQYWPAFLHDSGLRPDPQLGPWF